MARSWLRAWALAASCLLFSLVKMDSVTADDFKGMYWSNSLKPPFTDTDDATGSRILQGWAHGGSVQIKNNFVRLTPDKPSKTGWIFNTPKAPSDNWTALLRFRISGRAELMSGDGFGFWFLAADHFNTGMLMGGSDSIIGLGVLFDTYANDELHRDIVVVASDGHDPVLLSSGRRYPGCSSKFRRWEGRDDFDVEQESIAKISLIGSRIVVEIDAKGTGDFVVCVDQDIGRLLPKGDRTWRERAHFAVSAATGALSDNHDILEIITTSADQFERLMELHDEVADTPPVTVLLEAENVTTEDVGQHVNTLAYEVKDIDTRLQKLNHQIEHQVETVKHSLEELIENLTQQERKL